MPLTDATHIKCANPVHKDVPVVYAATFTKTDTHVFTSSPCPSCGGVECFQFSDNGSKAQTLIAQVAGGLAVSKASVPQPQPQPKGLQ